MFLRPGAIPDQGWTDEITQFVQRMEMQGDTVHAATFRRSNLFAPNRSPLGEALSMLKAALFSRVGADQGLIISRRHYSTIGGHRSGSDPEADLLRKVGRQLVTLRSGVAYAPD